jgi:hypothetical protein
MTTMRGIGFDSNGFLGNRVESPEEIYNSPGLVSVNDDSPNAPSPTPAR